MGHVDPEARRAYQRDYYAKNSSFRDQRREYNRQYYQENREQFSEYNKQYREQSGKKRYPESERAYHLRKTYGITPEEYDQLLERQGGCCAICGTDQPGKKYFSVDHDHDTGEVRGLLCQPCNIALGHVRDDLDVVMSMAAYLMRSVDVIHFELEGDV